MISCGVWAATIYSAPVRLSTKKQSVKSPDFSSEVAKPTVRGDWPKTKTGRHERTRIADPYRVKVVLYQLSYVPKEVQTRARCEHFGETAKVTKA